MFRLLGSLMIITGSTGLGFLYGQRLRKRINILYTLIKILNMLESEIEYGAVTMAQAFIDISRRLDMDSDYYIKEAFESIYEKMLDNSGENFSDIFRMQMTKCFTSLPLEPTDKKAFLSFMSDEGFLDKTQQLKLIKISKKQLEYNLEISRKQIVEKERISFLLGISGGILMVLILL